MSEMDRDIKVASAFAASGNLDAAVVTLKEVLTRDPYHADALSLLAGVYQNKGDTALAKETAEEVLAIDPGDATAIRIVVADLLARRKLRRAIKVAEQAQKSYPEDAANHILLAEMCAGMAYHDEAEGYFNQALELDPSNPDYKSLYADFLLTRGRLEKAGQIVGSLSREAPDEMSVILLRGRQALIAGDAEEAHDNIMWALQLQADNREALNLLAQLKMRRNVILGLIWRFVLLIGRLSDRRDTAILVALPLVCGSAYVLWRVEFARHSDINPVVLVLVAAFLLYCLMHMVAPAIVDFMVRRELKTVKIKPF